MTTSYGYLNLMGVGEESSYGVEAVVSKRIPFISSTLDDEQALIQDMSLEGRTAQHPPDGGVITCKGNVVQQMRYTLNNLFLKHCLGIRTADGTYTMHTPRDGLGLTVAIDKQVSVWVARGCKVGQWEIDSAIAAVRSTSTLVGQSLTRVSTLNTPEVLQALVDNDKNLLHRHLTFVMGPADEDIDDADAFDISQLKIMVSRKVDEVYTNSIFVHEPLDNAYPDASITATVPRYQSDQWKDWQQQEILLHARARWDNGDNFFQIYFSALRVKTAPAPTSGPGLLTQTVTLDASEGPAETGSTPMIEATEG